MLMRSRTAYSLLSAAVLAATAGTLNAQLRVVNWNITNYSGDRAIDIRSSVYGVFNGLSMSPDVIILEEIIEGGGSLSAQQSAGQAVMNSFVSILNATPGGPGDWAAAPYVANEGDTGNGLAYRTSKTTYIGVLTLNQNTGSGSDQAPRDTQRWRLRIAGTTSPAAELYLYGSHMKAGSTGADQARRVPEANRIRNDSNSLPAGAHFLLGGDFNVQNSGQTFYQTLLGSGSGQFFDPINSPGTWENNSNFRFIHTQDQTAMMDSRHDQILISASLRDNNGLSYIGSHTLPYSTTTWNDPNHSYRSWGNDGTSYDQPLRTTGNTMVGAAIAQALINSTGGGGGHLPVFLDLQIPAKLAAPTTINFGTVTQNSTAEVTINISNSVNVAVFSRTGNATGIDALDYSMTASAGFTAPVGSFSDPAAGAANSHIISMNTSTVGPKTGTLTITSNDPDQPSRAITITGTVEADGPPQPPPGDYDVNNDGVANIEDLYMWFTMLTDVNLDGSVDPNDLLHLRNGLRWFEPTDTVDDAR